MKERDNQGRITQGLKGHSKEYRFYSECKEKQQQDQKLHSGIIWRAHTRNHSSGYVTIDYRQ